MGIPEEPVYDPMQDNRLVINEDVKIIEYAPDIFAKLRSDDGYPKDIL